MAPKHICIALLIMFVWGINNTIIRLASFEIPPLLLLSLRLSIGGILFLPWVKKLPRDQIKPLFLYGLCIGFLHYVTLYLGLSYIEASLSLLISQTTTAFSVILGVFLFKEKIGHKTLIGLIIAYVGVLVIFSFPDADFHLLGALLTLFTCFMAACGFAAATKLNKVNFASMISYSYLGAVPFVFLTSLILENGQMDAFISIDPVWLAGILLYQAVGLSVSHFYWKELLTKNPISIVSPFMLTLPIFGLISAYFILGEVLSIAEIIGGVLTFIGITVIMARRAQKQAPSKS